MLKINREEVDKMDEIQRLNLVRSLTGYGPAIIIGTISSDGLEAISVLGSLVHLSSSPPLIGLVTQSTHPHYNNIKETGVYTINHIGSGMQDAAGKIKSIDDGEISEFSSCGLTPFFENGFKAPSVKESFISLQLGYDSELSLSNGKVLIVGEVRAILMKKDYRNDSGALNLLMADGLVISGQNTYHSVEQGKSAANTGDKSDTDKREKSRPDQVVYDEESGIYNAALLPYASTVGAPRITPTDLSLWKSNGAHKISRHLKTRFEEIRGEYERMTALFQWNELVYNAKFSFEPIIGETYHLYAKGADGQHFLSMIPPDTWSKECLGSFRLNTDQIWEKLDTQD